MVVALSSAKTAGGEGPEAGLKLLGSVEPRLAGHYRLDAIRAHFFEEAGELSLAIRHYLAAAARTTNAPEQQYLTTRAARLRLGGAGG